MEWTPEQIVTLGVSITALAGVVWKSVHNWLSTKFKTPADVRAEKSIEDEATEQAFQRLKGLLEQSDSRYKTQIAELERKAEERDREWQEKFAELDSRLNEVRSFNTELVKFVYVCINIIREAGLIDKLPKPGPNGIYY